ncbi:WHG domain-containing protein [Nakamurella sp. GG22]
MRAEVQVRAWEQIERDGVSALSLKAIATEMGMTAPALYRYYDSRDALLTELILSGYEDLAHCVEGATGDSHSPADRLTGIAGAMRRWATTHPQRYLLLYGTPVPGYHAPDAATELARRIFAPIVAAFELAASDREDLAMSPFRRSMTFWTRLHGVLSLELAGHFVGMPVDAGTLYDDEIRSAVATPG